MAYTNTIFQETNREDGTRVEVNARLAGNYEVIFWDTDAEKIVSVDFCPTAELAIAKAKKYVSGIGDGKISIPVW